ELRQLGRPAGELYAVDRAGCRCEIEMRAVERGGAVDAVQRRQAREVIDRQTAIGERAGDRLEAYRARCIGGKVDMGGEPRRRIRCDTVMDVPKDPVAGL